MTEHRDDRIAHALTGEWDADEAQAWADEVAADPALAREFESLRSVAARVGDLPEVAFDAGFADRTMARLEAERAEADRVVPLEAALRRSFRWVAPLAAAAAGVLFLLNVGVLDRETQSTWEALTGLDPITLESVYSIGEGIL